MFEEPSRYRIEPGGGPSEPGTIGRRLVRVGRYVVEDRTAVTVTETVQDNVIVAMVPLMAQDYDEYYPGFANKVLWPVWHYRLDLVRFEPAYFEGCKRFNKAFATALALLLREGDLISQSGQVQSGVQPGVNPDG